MSSTRTSSGAIVLFAFAALAAGARAPHAQAAPPTLAHVGLAAALVLAGAALTLGVMVAALALPPVRRRANTEPRRAPRRIPVKAPDLAALLAMFAVAAATLAGAVALLGRGPARGALPAGAPRGTGAAPAGRPGRRPVSPGVWLLAGAALTAGAAALIVLRPRPRGHHAANRSGNEPRASSVAQPGPWPSEPRAGIVEAYRRGEQVLAAHGYQRRMSDGPRDLRDRVDDADVADALARLTTLYERARFAAHRVSPAMAEDARSAYRDLTRRMKPTWGP